MQKIGQEINEEMKYNDTKKVKVAQDNQEDDLLAGLVGFDEPIGQGTNDEMTMIM